MFTPQYCGGTLPDWEQIEIHLTCSIKTGALGFKILKTQNFGAKYSDPHDRLAKISLLSDSLAPQTVLTDAKT